ncbi:YqeG family HAD IIIA-type phosphatase [Paucilactobacillus nenjiangensis]|jgi:HAD superfamily phosphatase (TIGR01668 family)|uniref:YqeG family HAD IIIA-type phosphatase n=1 Tax=Paucilactobacillus nenjiangensis TaxID=1296540 RepID=A0A5P1X072_9LACO|nr:YqeG family HAD IIIA-type phosphatase [Paucilactobacillus nenjiangensis]QER67290.1 YqeG family HAD IIIA-type phosphatase [Paucilactobacillus nenjiangensis]
MMKAFKPTWMVNTIYSISPSQLKSHGIRAVFTDLDNTLIAWNNPDGTPELKAWMQSLKDANIPLLVVSNNSHNRIERAVAKLELPFISRALKPLATGINRAMKKLELKPHEVVMVGDQLLTDIAASNQAGVYSILVKPLIDSDQWNTQINRFFEKYVMKQMLKENPTLSWQESLND